MATLARASAPHRLATVATLKSKIDRAIETRRSFVSTSTVTEGKSLVRAAFLGEKTERAPWIPFVGCHAATLIDVSADEFLKSTDLICRGVQAAIERYQPDGIPVAFDLQIEAEALGCDLNWSKDTPPARNEAPTGERHDPR